MNVAWKDIELKELSEVSSVEGTLSEKGLVAHTYTLAKRKFEVHYKGKATGLFWGRPPLLDGRSMGFGKESIDMELIKRAVEHKMELNK